MNETICKCGAVAKYRMALEEDKCAATCGRKKGCMTATEVHAIPIAGNKRASKYQDFFDQLDHSTTGILRVQCADRVEARAMAQYVAVHRKGKTNATQRGCDVYLSLVKKAGR